MNDKISEPLLSILRKHNIEMAGISDAKYLKKEQKYYEKWIALNYNADMEYLTNSKELKHYPHKFLSGCQSIIVIAINYFQKDISKIETDQGQIACYAWGRDYHKVLKNKLKHIAGELNRIYGNEYFKWYVDATPLSERSYAKRAGLGFIGKNTTLINPVFGSYFFIGEILTTKYFFPTVTNEEEKCGSCKKCIEVCPTKALKPYQIDCSRCISYLTIENKGPIPFELRNKMGSSLFGCDLCQQVCPYNREVNITNEADFLSHRAGTSKKIKEILLIENHEQFSKKFAGTPLMRAKKEGLIRNACIVASNNNLYDLIPILKELKANNNPVIAEHANWAIKKLEGKL